MAAPPRPPVPYKRKAPAPAQDPHRAGGAPASTGGFGAPVTPAQRNVMGAQPPRVLKQTPQAPSGGGALIARKSARYDAMVNYRKGASGKLIPVSRVGGGDLQPHNNPHPNAAASSSAGQRPGAAPTNPLLAAAQASVDATYQPQLDDLLAQRGQTLSDSKYLTGVNTSMTGKLVDMANAGQPVIANAGQQAQTAITGTRDDTLAQLAKLQAQGPAVGLTGNEGANQAQAALAQAGARTLGNAQIASDKSTGDTQSATTYQDALGRVAGLRGTENNTNITNNANKELASINEKRQSLVGARGDALTKTLSDMQTQAQDQKIAMAGLGIREDAINAGVQNNIRNNQTARRGQTIAATTQRQGQAIAAETARLQRLVTKRGQDITAHGQQLSHQDRVAANDIKQQAVLAKAASGAKGLAGLTPKQRLELQQSNGKIRTSIEAAAGLARNLMTKGVRDPKTGKVAKYDNETVLRTLAKSAGLDMGLARIAIDLSGGGGLSQQSIQALRERHITVPSRWLPAPAYQAPNTTSDPQFGPN